MLASHPGWDQGTVAVRDETNEWNEHQRTGIWEPDQQARHDDMRALASKKWDTRFSTVIVFCETTTNRASCPGADPNRWGWTTCWKTVPPAQYSHLLGPPPGAGNRDRPTAVAASRGLVGSCSRLLGPPPGAGNRNRPTAVAASRGLVGSCARLLGPPPGAGNRNRPTAVAASRGGDR